MLLCSYMAGKYPNTFYRVAAKALIRDDKGQILLVKEKSDKWDLPGGGLDHGEDPEDGIKREILEEIGISSGITVGKSIRQKSFWMADKQAWLMWIVYEVTLSDWQNFQPGEGVTDIAFIDPKVFGTSRDEREQYLTTFSKAL